MSISQWSCYHGVKTEPCPVCFSGLAIGFWLHRDGRYSDVFAGKPKWSVRLGCWMCGWTWIPL